MNEVAVVWLRPSLYVFWAVWGAVVFGLLVVIQVETISIWRGVGFIAFFVVMGMLSALEAKEGARWIWFELTGSPRERGFQSFLLTFVHGIITSVAAFSASQVVQKNREKNEEVV